MRPLLLTLLALSLGSCASTAKFEVRVNGMAAEEALRTERYVLEPARPIDPLEWNEFAAYVRRALEAEGFQFSQDASQADVLVRVDYGISGPEQYEYTYSDPVFGQVGETTTYTTNTNPYLGYDVSSTTTPEFGVTHYQTKTATATRFHRHLDLVAYPRSAGGKFAADPLWRTRMSSSGWSGDLRQVFPIMLAAGQTYLGRSTGREVVLSLKETDKRVAALGGGGV